MTNRSVPISNEQQLSSAAGELEELLRKQLEVARKGDATEIEVLANKTGELVERLSASNLFRGPRFERQRRHLQELYEQVCLVLSAQMDEVSQALGRISKGKKTVTLYRDNI